MRSSSRGWRSASLSRTAGIWTPLGPRRRWCGLRMIVALLAEVVAAGSSFTCTPTAVWDGDGPIWCAEGPRIRIAGVAAREIDESCSKGHPCPLARGVDARDRLVGLLGGPRGTLSTGHIKVRSAPMDCRSTGSAGGNRTGAWCISPDFGDLSCAVVHEGGAVRWQPYWGRHKC